MQPKPHRKTDHLQGGSAYTCFIWSATCYAIVTIMGMTAQTESLWQTLCNRTLLRLSPTLPRFKTVLDTRLGFATS